jgi:hypothetical protein
LLHTRGQETQVDSLQQPINGPDVAELVATSIIDGKGSTTSVDFDKDTICILCPVGQDRIPTEEKA